MAFDFQKLQTILDTELVNEQLFCTAFTHRSYLNENPGYKNPSNERLEFLGDAVLQLLSSEYLYKAYPEAAEGSMTNFRSSIVNTESIGEEAKKLGYGELLLLSNGEEATGGRDRQYILANTFEAVLGALYEEKGLEFCRQFLVKNLFYKIGDVVENNAYRDAKSKFQEYAQEKYNITPTYTVIESWGPDHDKSFKVAVLLNKDKFGEGEGKSKQRAEQQAALDALAKIS